MFYTNVFVKSLHLDCRIRKFAVVFSQLEPEGEGANWTHSVRPTVAVVGSFSTQGEGRKRVINTTLGITQHRRRGLESK